MADQTPQVDDAYVKGMLLALSYPRVTTLINKWKIQIEKIQRDASSMLASCTLLYQWSICSCI